MARLDGERIIVTGASRGLGREMALQFAAEGARVGLLARSKSPLETVAVEAPSEATPVPVDIRDAKSVSTAVDTVVDAFGGLDTVVNNAGVGILSLTDDQKPLVEITDKEWNTVLETNLTGVFYACRAPIPISSLRAEGTSSTYRLGLGDGRDPAWQHTLPQSGDLKG